jgi:hypothetical protein
MRLWFARAKQFGLLMQRAAGWIAVLAALVCFYESLSFVNTHGVGDLADRYMRFPPYALPAPSVVAWPLEYLWMLAKPWVTAWMTSGARHGSEHYPTGALVLFALGVGLVLAANVVMWARQDYSNGDARIAVWVWLISLSLNLFDLLRMVALPETWDRINLINGISCGEALRAAEMIASVYLLSSWMVLNNNRVRPDLFGPFAKIMNKVRRGLTWRGAIAAMLFPFIIALAMPILQRAAHPSDNTDVLTVIVEAALFLLVLWMLFLGGMWRLVRATASLGAQIIKTLPPIGRTNEPPPSPDRY